MVTVSESGRGTSCILVFLIQGKVVLKLQKLHWTNIFIVSTFSFFLILYKKLALKGHSFRRWACHSVSFFESFYFAVGVRGKNIVVEFVIKIWNVIFQKKLSNLWNLCSGILNWRQYQKLAILKIIEVHDSRA